MALVAWVGMARARRQFQQLARDVTGNNPVMQRRLMNKLASKARDMTRRNITTQGLGAWKKLSKWTVAQTGRRKALVTLRKFIVVKKAKGRATSASVVFNSPGDFTLTQHHDGYADPALGTVVKIELKRPGALGLPRKQTSKSFVDKRNRQVPARPVWPEGARLFKMLRVETRKWARQVDRRVQNRR